MIIEIDIPNASVANFLGIKYDLVKQEARKLIISNLLWGTLPILVGIYSISSKEIIGSFIFSFGLLYIYNVGNIILNTHSLIKRQRNIDKKALLNNPDVLPFFLELKDGFMVYKEPTYELKCELEDISKVHFFKGFIFLDFIWENRIGFPLSSDLIGEKVFQELKQAFVDSSVPNKGDS